MLKHKELKNTSRNVSKVSAKDIEANKWGKNRESKWHAQLPSSWEDTQEERDSACHIWKTLGLH